MVRVRRSDRHGVGRRGTLARAVGISALLLVPATMTTSTGASGGAGPNTGILGATEAFAQVITTLQSRVVGASTSAFSLLTGEAGVPGSGARQLHESTTTIAPPAVPGSTTPAGPGPATAGATPTVSVPSAPTLGSTTPTTAVPSTTSTPTTTVATTQPPSTTSTTTTTTTTSEPQQSGVNGGTVGAGGTQAVCIELANPGGVISDAQLQAITAVTGVNYQCVETFANPAPQWTDWEDPWPFRITSDGWDAWLAESPAHQVVLGEDLIPSALTNNNDPLTWEQPCDAGAYNQYATQLAENLVAAGAGNTVIRLGLEANGGWEIDYVGQTAQEQHDWAMCYDQEVTAMRAVAGAHFLFVWNPNTCTNDLGLANWYPGNDYVDIIGADAYDLDCNTNETVAQEGWPNYYIDSNAQNDASLSAISAFAAAQNKPFAIPEWGEVTGYTDDPAYVRGIASLAHSSDFSFQSYFDCGCDNIVQLGSSEPQSTTAYVAAFG